MPRPTTTVREVRDPNDPAVRQAYALLRKSFDRTERVPMRDWIGSLREKKEALLTDLVWHLVVVEQEGRVVGFTSGTYLGNVNVGAIGYLAIAEGVRAQGIGTRLRGRLRQLFHRDARRILGVPLDAIVGEVSLHNPWLRTLARRPGVILLDFPYHPPGLRDDDEPSRFVLYYEGLSRRRARLPVAELRRLLYALWRRGYRISRPLDRPAFRAMLRSLEGRRTIGSLKLSRGLVE